MNTEHIASTTPNSGSSRRLYKDESGTNGVALCSSLAGVGAPPSALRCLKELLPFQSF